MKLELEIAPLSSWVKTKSQPLVISGPCSAETERQLIDSCVAIAASGKVSMLRAGIWKPRTRPGEFEGIGAIGLDWLNSAKKETGLPTAVEVATAAHVEQSLKHGVDVLWIGARSTANPFTVQEIADSLRGVDVPVMIKNPVNPDLQLWIGALERINKAGITKIAAIHRGFSSYEKSAYRNEPMWELPVSLKTHCPELPIINDPSHITGNRELIAFISQKALDLDFQGLMIESHIDPSVAWTDAKQQVTPARLAQIIDELVIRKSDVQNQEFSDKLAVLRREIDGIDDVMIQKLAQRMKVVEEIGRYKKDNKVTVLQVNRWDEIMKKRTDYAELLQLDRDFIERFLELIHNESIRQQTDILNASTLKV